jgi:hypothetical protein
MAINFTDFSRAPLLDSPAKTIFEDVLKGYQISQEPAKMKREAEAKELANQLAQYKVQEEPQRFRTEQDYKKALMDKARNALQGGGLKGSGDVQNQLMIDSLRKTNPDEAERLQKVHDANMKFKSDRAENQKSYANSIAWRSLPAAEKQRNIAYGVGMNADATATAQALASGKTLADIANDKGYTLSEVKPSYPLSGAEIKDVRKRNAFNKEMGTLDKRITEGMAPYSQKVRGLSFQQVLDSLDELKEPGVEKQQKLAKFLAARALAPELAALRLNAMGGRVGIEGIRHLTDVSQGTATALHGLIDEDTYKEFQKYMTQYIDEAVKSYTNYIEGAANLGGQTESLQQPEVQSGSNAPRRVYDLSTRSFQ